MSGKPGRRNGPEQWSAAARDNLASAATELIETIQVHARTLLAMQGRQAETGAIFEASNDLGRAASRFADAQFDLTGVADPFGVLAQHYQVPENEGESEDEDGPIVPQVSVGEGLSMLRRDDYVVVDPERVIAEGRRSYLKVWPNDTEEDASRDVTDLSRALYQVAHAGGWDALTRLAGLQPTAKITWVIQNAQLIRGAPEGWPSDPFFREEQRTDNIIYVQKDV
ncbi:MAG: hypothetical protein E6J16_08035, partial [Chloroflexota bacterium]